MSTAPHSTTQNKGEWGEFYAFVKVLSTGELTLLEGGLSKSPSQFKEFVATVLELKKGAQLFYFSRGTSTKQVSRRTNFPGAKPRLTLPTKCADYSDIAQNLLNTIKLSNKTFSHPDSDLLAVKLGVTTKGAGSDSKADLELSYTTGQGSGDSDLLPVSVKCWLGSKPSLFNASKSTLIHYRVSGLEAEACKKISEQKVGPKQLVSKLIAAGARIEFDKYESEVFQENLSICFSEEIVPALVLAHHSRKGAADMKYLVGCLPSKLSSSEAKIKSALKALLRAVALGMTSAKRWDGTHGASDNYLAVVSSGELLLLVGRDKLEEYLFELTFVDVPSSGRHTGGQVVFDEATGACRLLLNFQLRLRAPRLVARSRKLGEVRPGAFLDGRRADKG